MGKYLLTRIGLIFLTLFITITVAFFIIRLMPDGKLADDPSIPEEVIERLNQKYGYDKPISTQYILWLGTILPHNEEIVCSITNVSDDTHECFGEEAGKSIGNQFVWTDWGESIKLRPGTPVFDYISEKIPVSMMLNIFALLISIPIGLFFGTVAALRKNTLTDHTISINVIILISVPSFVMASLMQYFVGFKLGLVPFVFDTNIPDVINSVLSGNGLPYFNILNNGMITPEGIDVKTGEYVLAENITFWPVYKKMLASMVMPILALSFGPIAGLTRYTRAELTEVLTSDFMMLAKSKGLTRTQATIRHGFRNSMVPLVGMLVGMFVGILGGSLIIERIFSINGMGGVTLESITAKDFSITLAMMVFYSSISLFTILLVDVLYGVVDPRIRLGGR